MSQEAQRKMEERWFIPRKRHIPCVWPLHTYWAWPVHKYFNVPTTGKVFSVWENGDYTVIFDREKTSTILGKAISEKILVEAKDLNNFRSKGIKAGEDTAAFCKEFADRSKEAVVSDYVSFFDNFTEEYVAIMKDNMHYWVMGAPHIEKKIRNELASFEQSVVDEIFHTMSAPVESSYSSKIDSELKNIIKVAKDKGIESAREDIRAFSGKYFWYPYEYVGPGIWSEKVVTDMVQKSLLDKSEPHSVISGDIASQRACIKKYALSKEVSNLFTILQALTLMSDDRKRYNSEICYYVNGVILPNLAEKLGISRDNSLYIDQEFLKTFEVDKQKFKERLVKRMEMLVEVTEDGVYSWYEGKEDCNKFLKSLDIHLEVDKDIKEIKGQIAYKGKVTGKVRVLKTSHVTDFAEGDIIVTGMTTPDFVPLIKQASAIITNEGGITCHAAIVAREMKKPCIIGTKIATQVLKDGQIVEVDADKGIVRIIK